jgi:hypothetical protein
MEILVLIVIGLAIYWLIKSGARNENKWKDEYFGSVVSYLSNPDINIFTVTEDVAMRDVKSIHAVPAFDDFVLLSDYKTRRWYYPQGTTERNIFLAEFKLIVKIEDYKKKIEEFKYKKRNVINQIKFRYFSWYLDNCEQAKYNPYDIGWEKIRRIIISRDGGRCILCGKQYDSLHVHHVVYRAHRGGDDAQNLISLCRDCHKSLPQHNPSRDGSLDNNMWYHTINLDNIINHVLRVNKNIVFSVLDQYIFSSNPLITHPKFKGVNENSVRSLLLKPYKNA